MRYFWVLLVCSFIFTSLAMFRLLRQRVPIEPTRVLDPTEFAAPENIGAAMFRRYYPEFSEAHLIILANPTPLPLYDRVWQGLFDFAGKKNWSPKDHTVWRLKASPSEVQVLREKYPAAVIIEEEPYAEKKFKRLDRAKLTAAAEFDSDKITHLYIYEPPGL